MTPAERQQARYDKMRQRASVRFMFPLYVGAMAICFLGLTWLFIGDPLVGIGLIVFAGIWMGQSQDVIRDALRDQLIDELAEFLERLDDRSVGDAK